MPTALMEKCHKKGIRMTSQRQVIVGVIGTGAKPGVKGVSVGVEGVIGTGTKPGVKGVTFGVEGVIFSVTKSGINGVNINIGNGNHNLHMCEVEVYPGKC